MVKSATWLVSLKCGSGFCVLTTSDGVVGWHAAAPERPWFLLKALSLRDRLRCHCHSFCVCLEWAGHFRTDDDWGHGLGIMRGRNVDLSVNKCLWEAEGRVPPFCDWSGLPFPFPGHLPYLGIEPRFPSLQADSLPSEPPYWEAQYDDNARQFLRLTFSLISSINSGSWAEWLLRYL